MSGLIAGRTMAKKPDPPVRLNEEIVRRARVVAAFEGKSLGDYLSDLLRPLVDRDFRRHIKRANEPDDTPGR